MKPVNKLWQWWTWGILFPLVALNGWIALLVFEYFRSLITVLVIATLLSFLLDYPVRLLRRYGMRRNRAVLAVLCLTLLVLIVLGVTIAPILLTQFNELVARLPSWINSGTQQIEAFHRWAESRNLPIDATGLASQLIDRLSAQMQFFTGEAIRFALGAAGSLLDVLLTIVLTFYLLLHGERLWDGLFQWLPPKLRIALQASLPRTFHNYFAGQATLASLMGLFMTVAFLILQVPFGLLFGLGVGVMTLIPFGAALSISIVSLLTALYNFWLGVKVLAVATVIDQVVENGIAPRLLGGFTGLNPVWILVSLLVGAKVSGIVGLLVAVPLASVIKNSVEMTRTATPENVVTPAVSPHQSVD